MRCLLLLLVYVTAVSCHAGGEQKVDSIAESSALPKISRNHYYEWNSADPSLRITDEDRETPARLRPEWIEWRKTLGIARTYQNALDEELHARVFEEAEIMVAEHNAAFARGESTYELGMNQFADMTRAEFARYRMSKEAVSARDEFYASLNETENSAETDTLHTISKQSFSSWDWRRRIPFTGVKDQGQCGSCYAFAAVAAIEAQYAMQRGQAVSLSEQFVVDCSYDVYAGLNVGCRGGDVSVVYDWLKSRRSLPNTELYPYTSGETKVHGHCRYWNYDGKYMIKRYKTGANNDEFALTETLVDLGPPVTSISGENRDFQLFRGGIYNNPNCPKTLDHVVLAVGYGTELYGTSSAQDYWTIRNSWGTSWGEEGYGKIARGVNQCGFPGRPLWPEL